MAVDTLGFASSEKAASAEVVGKNTDLGGAQREYVDLKESDPALEQEDGVDHDTESHLSGFEQRRASESK